MGDVKLLSVVDLASRLENPGDAWFLDVRTAEEWTLARIEGFRLLDPTLLETVSALERNAPLVFLCHHGMRSDAAARHFAANGFHDVWNVSGGIDAWAREVDPAVPRY